MELILTILFIAFVWSLIEKHSPNGRLRQIQRSVRYLEERERKREKEEKKEKENDEDDDIRYF